MILFSNIGICFCRVCILGWL